MTPRRVLAIDPGNVASGWALIDVADCRPVEVGVAPNAHVRALLTGHLADERDGTLCVAVEMIGHYGTGMNAGRSVFDTCREIGRIEQVCDEQSGPPVLVLRATVKTHLCGTPRANDSNVIQALVDRFAPGQPNRGKGTKADPGWFHGFSADAWQAYALGVTVADYVRTPQHVVLGLDQDEHGFLRMAHV